MNVEKRRGVSRNHGHRNRLTIRMDRIARSLRLDTQRIRERLIHELEVLFEMANKQAADCHPKSWKEKQNWARITAYISQVINSVGNTYDLKEIEKQVSDLKKQIPESQFDLAKMLSGLPDKKQNKESTIDNGQTSSQT